MTFINEYKNRGGRITTGSDSGFIYQLYGFAYIRELELLREAGFHPLEVIKAATLNGAEALGAQNIIGSVEIGKLADFVIIEENPLENLKVLAYLPPAGALLHKLGEVRSTPFPKAYRFRERYTKSSVAIEDGDADLDFCDLPLKVPRHQRLAQ